MGSSRCNTAWGFDVLVGDRARLTGDHRGIAGSEVSAAKQPVSEVGAEGQSHAFMQEAPGSGQAQAVVYRAILQDCRGLWIIARDNLGIQEVMGGGRCKGVERTCPGRSL